MNFIITVWEKHKYDKEFLDSECKKWLQLLIGMVDLTKDHPEVLLKEFISQTPVRKKYFAYISEQVLRNMLDPVVRKMYILYSLHALLFFLIYRYNIIYLSNYCCMESWLGNT